MHKGNFYLTWPLSAFSSLSNALVDPHFATCESPVEAIPPYSQTLQGNREQFGKHFMISYLSTDIIQNLIA